MATVTFLQVVHILLAYKDHKELSIAGRWVAGIALLGCLIFKFSTALIGPASLFFVIVCLFWNLYRAVEEMNNFKYSGNYYVVDDYQREESILVHPSQNNEVLLPISPR